MLKAKGKQYKLNIYGPWYFGYWSDLFLPVIANKVLFPAVLPHRSITPNIISLASFIIFLIGDVLILSFAPGLLFIAGLLIIVSYILDCLDGQIARARLTFSMFGSFADKSLDVLKIFLLFLTLSYVAFIQTHNILFALAGFTASSLMFFRFYIKYVVMFNQFDTDKSYFEKSRDRVHELYDVNDKKYMELNKTFVGKIKAFFQANRLLVYVDEGDFMFFAALGVMANRIPLILLVLCITQIYMALWRWIQRGYQIARSPNELLDPVRK